MTAVTRSKKKKKDHFFGEVQSELKKVTWTSKKELKMFTKIVIASTLVFGLAIYLVDLSIRTSLDTLRELVNWMVG